MESACMKSDNSAMTFLFLMSLGIIFGASAQSPTFPDRIAGHLKTESWENSGDRTQHSKGGGVDTSAHIILSGNGIIALAKQAVTLGVSPESLDFGTNDNLKMLTIQNIGVKRTKWSLEADVNTPWIVLPLTKSGTLDPQRSAQITIRINRTLIDGGIHEANLRIVAEEFEHRVPLKVSMSGSARPAAQSQALDFRAGLRNLTTIVSNDGGGSMNWSVERRGWPMWLQRVYPASGTLGAGEKAMLNITVNRAKLAAGEHTFVLKLDAGDKAQELVLKISMPVTTGRRIYVSKLAKGSGNGDSWENAFTSIRDAVADAGRLSQTETADIWIAEGIYYEHEIHLSSGIRLFGGFRGDETLVDERSLWHHPSIVDGQKRGRCFECEHRTLIDGFTIQNGRDWGTGDGKGAAILAYDADIQIRNNLIRNNVNSWAGSLFIDGFDQKKQMKPFSPIIERNVFIDNFSNYCAAAIEIRGSTAVIRHNTIVGNQGFGLEIQDFPGPDGKIVYGDFYNNIITDNQRKKYDDVWAEARKSTNYSFVGKRWSTSDGSYKPYDLGTGNIFGDITQVEAGFINKKNDNFRLRSDSPCIDAGDPKSGRDPDGSIADLGAFPFNRQFIELELSPRTINFGAESIKKSLTVSAYGGVKTEWAVAAFSQAGEVISIEPAGGTLSNGERATLEITLDRTGLKDARHEAYIAIMTPERSYEVTASFIANNSLPEITLEPDVLKLVAVPANTPRVSKRVQVNNAVYGDLNWKASKRPGCDWLSLNPSAGQAGDMMTIEVDMTRLPFGEHYEEIWFDGVKVINAPVILPVEVLVQSGKFILEIEAERSTSLPNPGWAVVDNEGQSCLQALKNTDEMPDDQFRLDYGFQVPEGVDRIYVFAEVDVNRSRASDSFWMMINGFDPCDWDYIDSKNDGWIRSWVYHIERDKQHPYVVWPGANTLNLFSREAGAYVNWIVITNDPDLNIKTYQPGVQKPQN